MEPSITFKVVVAVMLMSAETGAQESPIRDPSLLKLLFRYHQPPYTPEPFTYPGPSPPVPPGNRLHNAGYPHYVLPSTRPSLDLQALPKWCDNMWQRDECGMKCWMLRKICWNIAKQGELSSDHSPDVEPSSSVSYPYVKPPTYKKPVIYTKAGVSPNMYYAQTPLYYPQYKRIPMSYYRRPPPKTEYGLNQQFTYIDDDRTTTTTTPSSTTSESNATVESTTENSVPHSTTTEALDKANIRKLIKEKIIKLKGPFGVKVTYPDDSEVATLSPLMFDYDQYSSKKYYGDRIYMSTVIPVSERRLQADDEFSDFDDLLMTID